ncbi:MAG: alpha/beta hydrolase [Solirubrobacterales bacterium]
MATFGLVHGGMHGAAHWERLRPELDVRGHESLVVDLPCEDAEATLDDYREAALAAFADAPDDVLLVGHSFGGTTIPLVAERRPVAKLIFLCAVFPNLGRSLVESAAERPGMVPPTSPTGRPHGEGRVLAPHEEARAAFYHDCDEAEVAWAVARLRPQGTATQHEVWPLEAWPDVPAHYIYGREDRCVSAGWVEREMEGLLGTPPLPLDGSHSPFLARPAELADLLDRLARAEA